MTNEDWLKTLSTEELAEFLSDINIKNGCEYGYGICAYQDKCNGYSHAREFCIEQTCKWLETEREVKY